MQIMNMKDFAYEAVIITGRSDLFYFTGYDNEDARVVLTADKRFYITDTRCLEEANELLVGFEVTDSGSDSYNAAAANILKAMGIFSAGVTQDTIKYNDFRELSDCGLSLSDASIYIRNLRTVKTDIEIAKITAAQKITDKAFEKFLDYIRPGMSEKQCADKLNMFIYESGAVLAFDTICAFGKNTSRPHAHPSDNVLKSSDIVTVDFGAKLNGYCSDMTRSFAVGKVPYEYEKAYNLVLLAQETAIDGLKAGITGRFGDALARKVFESANTDKYFTHSLGHSLGVDIHENPRLSKTCDTVIPENAVLSVEPGLYFPTKFGIRIEDIVVFKNNRVENLTKSPKSLIIL